MLYLATHIGVWILVAFAFGLVIGWFLWGQWVGIDMNRDYSHSKTASSGSGDSPAGSISVLSDSLLKTQRELERCQQSLAEAEARLGTSEIRYSPQNDTYEGESFREETFASMEDDGYGDSEANGIGEDSFEESSFMSSAMNGEAVDIERDDLKKIYGIGPVIERKLAELDIITYRQIALLSPEEITIVSEHINYFPGRIERDGWLESARELHQDKYGEDI